MIGQLITNEEFTNVQTAQAGLTRLFAKASKNRSFYRVMRNAQPLGVLVPDDLWLDLIEDLEALSSPRYLESIRKARGERTYSIEEVEKELGL